MAYIRTILFYTGLWIATVYVVVFGVFLLPFDFNIRYGFIRQWALFNLWWLEKTCGVRMQVKGQQNIPDSNAIIFCKHQSTWETLALQKVFPPQIWLLKKQLLMVPFFGWGLAMLEPIPIDRSKGTRALKQLIIEGKKRLERGRWVVIFPEGTRLKPGIEGKYHKGGAVLAEKSAYPVVPVAHNAGRFWVHKQFLKVPGTITMSIGPVIETSGKSANEILDAAKSWIEEEMQQLS